MQFKVGQKVVFLQEVGGGIIQSINEYNRCIILDEDGFKKSYNFSQLVGVSSEEYAVDDTDANSISESDNNLVKKKTSGSKSKRIKKLPEINLHIEELTESHIGLTNYEILSKQMIAFKRFYDISKSRKQRKIIIIHGRGEGVLRQEVRSFLNGEEGVEYYDADYTEYGQGATTIELKYKN